MTPLAVRGAAALILITAMIAPAGLAQPGGLGVKVFYRDKANREGPEKIIDGEQLKLAPAGVQVINKGAVSATISADDIVRVDPGELPPLDRKEIAAQITLERERKWEPALATYVEMEKKAKTAGAQAPALRYLQYKIAYTSGRAADEAPDSEWKDKTMAAQKLLNSYLIGNEFKGGWEIWQVGKMRARMVLELDIPKPKAGDDGKIDPKAEAADAVEGANTWARLAKSPDLAADLQREAALEEIDYLFRSKQFPTALKNIETLKPGATGVAKDRLALYEAAIKCAEAAVPNSPTPITQIVKPLQDLVDQFKDPGVKAVGYNLLGEVCMFAEKPREAMWNYLWVEVVYNQDRDEVFKAMVRLVKSFELQGDEDRIRNYREKLRRIRG